MELTQDQRAQLILKLIPDLLSEMKMGAGSKLKPKAEVIEVSTDKVDPEDKEGLAAHLDKVAEESPPDEDDLEGLMDDEDKTDEEDKQYTSSAKARLDRKMARQ